MRRINAETTTATPTMVMIVHMPEHYAGSAQKDKRKIEPMELDEPAGIKGASTRISRIECGFYCAA